MPRKRRRQKQALQQPDTVEMERRYLSVEAALARGMSPLAIEVWAADKWGVKGRAVRDWIMEVRRRWTREAADEDRTELRNRMRATLREIVQLALNRVEVVRDRHGEPMRDERGQVMTMQAPELGPASFAARTLCQLDGLLETKLKVEGPSGLTVSIFARWTEEQLRRYLEGQVSRSVIEAEVESSTTVPDAQARGHAVAGLPAMVAGLPD